MFKRHNILKKVLLVSFTLCLLFVFSGLGVLSVPKPAQAQWLVLKNIGELLEHVFLAIWKYAIYPLLKKVIISLIVNGDWGMTAEELSKWAYQDLAFQTVNAIFKSTTGFSLCTKISDWLKMSITLWVAPDYTPDCTYDNSDLMKLLEDLADDPEAIKERLKGLRKDLFGAIINSNTKSNNEIGLSLDTMAIATDRDAEARAGMKSELAAGDGLLATRSCKVDETYIKSQGQKIDIVDKNRDGIVDSDFQPGFCRKTALEGWASDAIKNASAASPEALQVVTSEVLTDLLSLTGMAISTAIEHHALNPLKQYLVDSLLDDDSSSLAETQQGAQKTGKNRLITYPTDSTTSAPLTLSETK